MPQDFGEYDSIDAGEKNYEKLFNSYWCPLLGRKPDIGLANQNSNESRSIEIISNARKLWDIEPMREYTPTDQLIENTSDETKEKLSYPQWRVDAAQAIARTYTQTKQDINAEEWNREETLDSNSGVTIDIVRKLVDPHLDDQIKGYHILAILAIAEAFHVLKDILYPKKGLVVINHIPVAASLLAQANKISLEESVLSRQEKIRGISYLPTKPGTKWFDVCIYIRDNEYLKIKIDGSTHNVHRSKMSFKIGDEHIAFQYSRSCKPTKLWELLKVFAKFKYEVIEVEREGRKQNINIGLRRNDIKNISERKQLSKRVERLNKLLIAFFRINDKPIPAYNDQTGYTPKFLIEDISPQATPDDGDYRNEGREEKDLYKEILDSHKNTRDKPLR
jgi:hypothetical protein